MNDNEAWCTNQWRMLRDRGIWAVPRSGMIFQKLQGERKLMLVSQMPHVHDMPITPEQLEKQQEGEFQAIKEQFAGIGISVERSGRGGGGE